MKSYILGLRCPRCSKDHVNADMTTDPICPIHGENQAASYDIDAIKRDVDRDGIPSTPKSIWRWGALLPVRDHANVVSLFEGDTPLFHVTRLGDRLGLQNFYIKDESCNPTGSFKDRGASVTVSKSREVGVKGLILASSGNAATAFSAYSARGGIPFYGFLRDETSAVHRLQTSIYGNRIFVVEGDMVDGTQLAGEVAKKRGLFHCTQPYNLYRAEGKKTIAFEICEALKWEVPDRILVPTSGGTNVLAIYQGFQEMNALGWVKGMPAIDVVQIAECAPIVHAWKSGEPVKRGRKQTIKSTGLGHPFPAAGDRVVQIMKATGGVGWTVSDAEAFEAARLLARAEGLFVQPASATPIACFLSIGAEQARKAYGNQVIIGIATGSGKNQVDEPLAEVGRPPRIVKSLAAFEAADSGS
ncbi:MAG: threonine synthase [Sulfuricaulis sp.]|uniref:threonine synthase n=1 Tax=Sulfuricaulis sp. TaxID=2003553 RepID=UPI0034A11E69